MKPTKKNKKVKMKPVIGYAVLNIPNNKIEAVELSRNELRIFYPKHFKIIKVKITPIK